MMAGFYGVVAKRTTEGEDPKRFYYNIHYWGGCCANEHEAMLDACRRMVPEDMDVCVVIRIDDDGTFVVILIYGIISAFRLSSDNRYSMIGHKLEDQIDSRVAKMMGSKS